MGAKLGQNMDQIQYYGTSSLDMYQNSKYDLEVLDLILDQRKCILNCTPGLVQAVTTMFIEGAVQRLILWPAVRPPVAGRNQLQGAKLRAGSLR